MYDVCHGDVTNRVKSQQLITIAFSCFRFRQQSAADPHDPHILVRIATAERFSPISLCRILLAAEYADSPKFVCQEMLNNPNIIPDIHLAQNVMHCLYNDSYDGQMADIIRRSIGEGYEVRLKKLAADAGLPFHDEVYLRRHGYDKTPDLKLAIPCMYKGHVINWIESKASFGDLESHQRYVQEQLASYANRFGAGVVIYWFGYLDKVLECRENGHSILIADQFPDAEDLVLMEL